MSDWPYPWSREAEDAYVDKVTDKKTLWDDEPFSLTLKQVGRDARRAVREGVEAAGLMPREVEQHPDDVRMERALKALDVIRLGVEGHLRLKGQALSPYGVTTVYSSEPYLPSDAKICRAAVRVLTGRVQPRRR